MSNDATKPNVPTSTTTAPVKKTLEGLKKMITSCVSKEVEGIVEVEARKICEEHDNASYDDFNQAACALAAARAIGEIWDEFKPEKKGGSVPDAEWRKIMAVLYRCANASALRQAISKTETTKGGLATQYAVDDLS